MSLQPKGCFTRAVNTLINLSAISSKGNGREITFRAVDIHRVQKGANLR